MNKWSNQYFTMLQRIINLFKVFTYSPFNPVISSTLHATSDELSKIFNERKVCPDCERDDFYEGPSGGMSTNIVCGNCGSWFNVSPFNMSRIHNCVIDITAPNYREFTNVIINTWNTLEMNMTSETAMQSVIDWCEFSLGNQWSLKWGDNKHDDAMKFIIDLEKDLSLVRNIIESDYTNHGYTPSIKAEVIDWLDENCVGWRYNGIVTLPGEYNEVVDIDFINETDIVAFKLRWS